MAYRVGRIDEVIDYHRVYKINGVPTKKALRVSHGKAQRVFLMDVVSNKPFTEVEAAPLTLPSNVSSSVDVRSQLFTGGISTLGKDNEKREAEPTFCIDLEAQKGGLGQGAQIRVHKCMVEQNDAIAVSLCAYLHLPHITTTITGRG